MALSIFTVNGRIYSFGTMTEAASVTFKTRGKYWLA